MTTPVRTGITFTPAKHLYRLDGQAVPSVTTLIKGGLPAPALTYWSARSVAEYVADNDEKVEQLRGMGRNSMIAALKEVPWTARDTAAVRGTEVHAFAEELVHGRPVDAPEHLVGYVEACARFLDDYAVAPLLVEMPVAHREHWWAGRFDLIAGFGDGRTVLCDFKTSKGVYAETAFQLAAYSHAEFYQADDGEHPLPALDGTAAVHLTDSEYSLIPTNSGDETYKAFRHIAHVARIAKTAKDLILPAENLTGADT